ncbi:DUF2254 domain-containing protein [Bradyrhizobium sp.]|uniref:DUF2254 domain-containing protein n=1 Tax=Bradyrhizobium sp. TaxID=376 RepID=UPI0025C17F39|nr:DUF2254 domain-containing protein [Bradyrhizobium sp.]
MLSAIAGSMITVAGLTFSITMLTLQLASSQFGPRLLRNAMRDRGNQVVLGTFISTFAYCLLVLRTVRGTEGASSVPHLSVAVGVLLALASLGVLIYFIHHVANAIRIETVLAQLATETNAAIDQLYPERLGQDPPDDAPRAARRDALGDFADREVCIQAAESGYVKRLDTEALMRMATEHNLVVWIEARPGRFVIEQQVVLSASPSKRIPAEIADALRGTLVIGPDRSPDQDVAHALRRIVEIAQRALSPGINDPTTAIYCLDRMEEALMRLAARDVPPPTLRQRRPAACRDRGRDPRSLGMPIAGCGGALRPCRRRRDQSHTRPHRDGGPDRAGRSGRATRRARRGNQARQRAAARSFLRP